MKVHVGCGGLLFRGREVLLIERINSSTFDGEWANPGGLVEAKETVEQACIREFKEEIDLVVRIVRELRPYYDYREGSLYGVYTEYVVELVSGESKNMEPDKIKSLGFKSVDNLPSPLAAFTKQYLNEVGY